MDRCINQKRTNRDRRRSAEPPRRTLWWWGRGHGSGWRGRGFMKFQMIARFAEILYLFPICVSPAPFRLYLFSAGEYKLHSRKRQQRRGRDGRGGLATSEGRGERDATDSGSGGGCTVRRRSPRRARRRWRACSETIDKYKNIIISK